MIKAIIFDLDGVIVDSEPVHFKAHRKILKEFGISLTKEDYLEFGVARGDEFLLKTMAKKYKKKINVEEARRLKKKYYISLISTDLKLRKGIKRFLESVDKKYKLALASSSKKEVIELVLKNFDLFQYFKTITSGGEVKKVKPAPDIYLKSIEKAGVLPMESLAIEDSETGVISAKKAGLRCVAFPGKFTRFQDFSKADVMIKNIAELNKFISREIFTL